MTEREEASLESCIIDNDGDVSLTRALFDTLCVYVCACVIEGGESSAFHVGFYPSLSVTPPLPAG